MAKARVTRTKSKRAAAGKQPAKPVGRTTRKPAAKAKAKRAAETTAKTKAKTKKPNIFGGVAKGFAWLGAKVRGVVGKKRPAKKKSKPKAKKPKPEPSASESALVTLNNPLP